MNLGAVTKTDRSNIQIDEALVLNAALFGLPQEEVVQSQPVKQIVQSHLNIVLSGTMVVGDVSAAVVALDGRAIQQVFFVGDDIKGGAILHKVDAIVVDRNGLLERIYLKKAKAVGGFAKQSQAGTSKVIQERSLNRAYLNQQMRHFPKLTKSGKSNALYSSRSA